MVRLGEIVLIHDLKRQGLSVSAIARKLGLDRKTVRKHLERGMEAPAYGPRAPRPPLIEPFEDYLARPRRGLSGAVGQAPAARDPRAAATPAATASSPTSCARCGRRGGRSSSGGSRPPPGKQAQVDFAQFRVEFTDEPGVVRILWLFTMVLGHSRWLWGRFCATQDLQTVLRCHIDAFAAMAGAPSELLYDRMKTAVIGEDAEGVVQLQRLARRAAQPLRRRCRAPAGPTGPRPRARSSGPTATSARTSSWPHLPQPRRSERPVRRLAHRRSPTRGSTPPPAGSSTSTSPRSGRP